MHPGPKGEDPINVFFSYAHEDEHLGNKLLDHLKNLKRQGVIDDWYDREITPGDEWEGWIKERLNTADIIILLVSADFMASDFCYDVEMTRALERHKAREAIVIPVILRPVDWDGAPFSHLQALPTDAKPITKWDDIDDAFLDVVQGIRSAVQSLKNPKKPAPRKSKKRSKTSKPKSTPKARKTKWVMVFSGTVDDMDKPTAEAILEHLRALSGDATLTMKRVAAGSVKIYLEGSVAGYNKVLSLFTDNKLTNLEGLAVEDVYLAAFEDLKSEDKKVRQEALSDIIENYLKPIRDKIPDAFSDKDELTSWYQRKPGFKKSFSDTLNILTDKNVSEEVKRNAIKNVKNSLLKAAKDEQQSALEEAYEKAKEKALREAKLQYSISVINDDYKIRAWSLFRFFENIEKALPESMVKESKDNKKQ